MNGHHTGATQAPGRRFVEQYFKVIGRTSSAIDKDFFEVTFPTNERFSASARNTDWPNIATQLTTTGQLYLYSGNFLATLPHSDPLSERIVNSFWTWANTDDFRSRSGSFGSWDHGTAMRIEVATYLILAKQHSFSALIYGQLWHDVEWACGQGKVKNNNHGVFLLGALLLVSKLWTDLESSGENRGAVSKSSIEEIISSRLVTILDYVYGDDGWCGENSPIYDRVWINLLNRLQKSFTKELARIGALEILKEKVQGSDVYSRAQLLPNGRYVPRGDTPRMRTNLTPAHGTFHSTRAGIWIRSSPQFYLMATAGHASIAHKHVDDTAVYLAAHGIDLFLDGGFHSYNYMDPRVVSLKSAVGHSALGVDGYDDMPPWIAYKASAEKIRGRLHRPSETAVTLDKALESLGLLRREIATPAEGRVLITDSWELRTASTPVARFLLANNAQVSQLGEKQVLVSRLGVEALMQFSDHVQTDVVEAESQPPYRGWYSTKANSFVAGKVLEIRPPSASPVGALQYNIRVRPNRSPEAPTGAKG